MNLKDLFTDISGFAEFVPGIDANINFALLNSHAVTAYKRIANIVSVPVYEKIIEQGKSEMYDYLRTALANLVMAMIRFSMFFANEKQLLIFTSTSRKL